MKKNIMGIGLSLLLVTVAGAAEDAKPMTTDEKVDILAREIEELKTGKNLFQPVKEKGRNGMGPAASKVYETNQGISIGGYGEMVYQNYMPKNESGDNPKKTDQYDTLRAILYFGYKFSDKVILNTELEFEHADEASVEFAYVDYMPHPAFNIRGGLLLLPMGFVNELHEPILFSSANRPLTETRIIPTTWREGGAGIYGSAFGFSYKAYLVNGFNGRLFDDTGLRAGRQKGSKASADNLAGAGRLDFDGINGLLVGVSGYYGASGQSIPSSATSPSTYIGFNAMTSIGDVHAEFRHAGFYIRLLGTVARITDAHDIDAVNTGSIGSEMLGGYGELGYDIFRIFGINQELTVFTRFEQINTQAEVPVGVTAKDSNLETVVTAGLNWKPLFNLVLKADWEAHRNGAKTGTDQANLALGYVF